jgi:hypothetical protein
MTLYEVDDLATLTSQPYLTRLNDPPLAKALNIRSCSGSFGFHERH